VQQEPETLNLERAIAILRRRALLIALCVVVVAGAAFVFSRRETKKYTATASLVFSTNPLSQQIAGLPGSSVNSSDLLVQETRDVELVKSSNVATKTASVLGRGLTGEKVAGSLSVTAQGESGTVDVTAITTSPVLSAVIVNTYARQVAKEQQNAQLNYYKSALAIIRKQLAGLTRQERAGPGGAELQERAQTLSLLSGLKEGNVKVTAEAAVPTAPSSPKTSRNMILGVVVGLLIGLGLALALERLDRRIKRPEDLEAIYRLPLLGAIPESGALARSARERGSPRAALPPAEAEAFNLVRAHLRFFNVDRDLRTIVIASPAQGDGKTTVARHLAEAAARLGSRVLLLELDLRHPTLAQHLDIQSGPGLADVLVDATPIGEATQSVTLEVPPGEGARGRTLDVLAAGAVLPPNPGELLDSHAMESVLEQARSVYDVVVVDTPPLNAVSDAFPLLTKVDGVVIVGWVGRSRRDAAQRLHQVLSGSGAPLLGVVANGSKSGDTSTYADVRDGRSSGIVSASKAPSSEELVPTAEA
jgi:polysaccharide biosynthesis transport protein